MAFSVNGFGTTFYGHADEDADGSYVATEWVVVLFLPLLPMGSKRLWPIDESHKPFLQRSVGQPFQSVKVPLHLPHVAKGYAVTLGLLLLVKLLG